MRSTPRSAAGTSTSGGERRSSRVVTPFQHPFPLTLVLLCLACRVGSSSLTPTLSTLTLGNTLSSFFSALHIPSPPLSQRSFATHSRSSPRPLSSVSLSSSLPTFSTSAHSEVVFPRNVSATYKGDWSLVSNGSISYSASGERTTFTNTRGLLYYRVVTSLLNDEVHLADAIMNVRDGTFASESDLRFHLRGFYIPPRGELALYAGLPNSEEIRELIERADSWNISSTLQRSITSAFEVLKLRYLKDSDADAQVTPCHVAARFQMDPYSKSDKSDPAPTDPGAGPGGQSLPPSAQRVSAALVRSRRSATMTVAEANAKAESDEEDSLEQLLPLPLTMSTSVLKSFFAPFESSRVRSPTTRRQSLRHRHSSHLGESGSVVRDDDDTPSYDMTMAGNISSVQCAFNLSVWDVSVVRYDLFEAKVINYCIMVVTLSAVQIYVLMRQMRDSSTSSRAVKVAMAAIAQQALLDSYLCFVHLAAAMYMEPLFHAFLVTALFEFVIFSLFEMRFLLSIWKALRPDAFANGFEVMRREFSRLYVRFYVFLIMGLVLLYQLRQYLPYLVVMLYSFWIPQIVSNAMNDVNKSLSPAYVIVMSVSRLLIPLYVWGCPYNFMAVATIPGICIALVTFITVQVLILLLQDRFGPRFFVPSRFLPPKYDYHDIVQLPDSMSEGEENPCAICYSGFDPNMPRTTIMRTPCAHTFHTECLTRWMDQKMECPTCRGVLPPL